MPINLVRMDRESSWPLTYTWAIRRSGAVFVGVPHFMEVVFIELSHETCKVAVFKMLRKDMFCELLVLSWRQRVVLGSPCKISYLEDHKTITLISPSDNALILWAFQHSTTSQSVYRPQWTFGRDLLTCTACAPTKKSAWYSRDRMTSALTKSLELFAPIPGGPSIVDDGQWAQW